jgi:hypothetical protein
MSRYAWIPDRHAEPPTRQRRDRRGRRRDLPAVDPPRDPKATMPDGRRFLNVACPRCGHAPFAWHKRCAACLGPRPDSDAGHFGGGFEHLAWLALLLIFIVVLLRLLGVAI